MSDPFKRKEIQDRMKRTNLSRYGTEWGVQSDEIKQKIRETQEERYGGMGLGSDQLKSRIINTNLERYGSENPAASPEIKTKIREAIINSNSDPTTISRRRGSSSLVEQEVYSFLSFIYDGEIRKDRRILEGKEIDFFFPELSIGIEFQGDYWHSDREIFRDKYGNYPSYWHEWKWHKAQEKGVDLYFVWEKDWREDKELVKSVMFDLIETVKNCFEGHDILYNPNTVSFDEIDKKYETSFLRDML